MEMTQAAAHILLHIIKGVGLNNLTFCLKIQKTNKGCALSFAEIQAEDHPLNFYGLQVVAQDGIDKDNVLIDYRDINGKRGLVFVPQSGVRHVATP